MPWYALLPTCSYDVLFGNPEGGLQRGTMDAGFRRAVLRIPFGDGAPCDGLPQYLCPTRRFGTFSNHSANCFEDQAPIRIESINKLNHVLRRCVSHSDCVHLSISAQELRALSC
jgi:hypothetical protein